MLSLKTIYKQTKLPDKVILWLALSDFPNKMEDLPAGLRRLPLSASARREAGRRRRRRLEEDTLGLGARKRRLHLV